MDFRSPNHNDFNPEQVAAICEERDALRVRVVELEAQVTCLRNHRAALIVCMFEATDSLPMLINSEGRRLSAKIRRNAQPIVDAAVYDDDIPLENVDKASPRQ